MTADIYHLNPKSGSATIASGGGGPHDPAMEARVAVLEQMAKSTETTLKEIRDDLRAMRAELTGRMDKADERLWVNSRWLLATQAAMFVLLAGIMAKGFHWF